jgi:hypothetical protein
MVYHPLISIDIVVILLDMCGYTLHYTKLHHREKIYSLLKLCSYYSTSSPLRSHSPSIELQRYIFILQH